MSKLQAAKLEGSPSALYAKFQESNYVQANPEVSQAVATALDAMDTLLDDLTTMEQYIHLTIPKMEDGNNFGVTVQLAAMKQITDGRDKMDKAVDELSKYAASRAEAVEKCGNLVSKMESKTLTSSLGKSTGGKDGDTNTTSESSETKSTESTSIKPSDALRQKAVLDVDVLYYGKAKRSLEWATMTYLAVLDFCDKNQEKLAAPKGSNGGGGYSSMY